MNWAQFGRSAVVILKSLPGIKFALLLGAGMVVTAFAAFFAIMLTFGAWPESAALERVRWLGIGMCISLGLVGVLMMTLAGVKLDRLAVTTSLGSAEVDMAGDPPH